MEYNVHHNARYVGLMAGESTAVIEAMVNFLNDGGFPATEAWLRSLRSCSSPGCEVRLRYYYGEWTGWDTRSGTEFRVGSMARWGRARVTQNMTDNQISDIAQDLVEQVLEGVAKAEREGDGEMEGGSDE